MLHAIKLVSQIGMIFFVAPQKLLPGGAQVVTALADSVGKMLAHPVRYQELGVFRPAVGALGKADFILSQRFAVSFTSVLLVGRAVSNVAIDDDEGWAVTSVVKQFQGAHE